jgi:hypothetical protein
MIVVPTVYNRIELWRERRAARRDGPVESAGERRVAEL